MFHWVLNKDICEIWLVIFVDYDSYLGISVISWNWRQRTGGKELGTVHKNMAMAWKNPSVMAINVSELDPIQIVDFYWHQKFSPSWDIALWRNRNAFDRLKLDSQVSSVQSLSLVWLFATPWTEACHASLSIPAPGVYSSSCPLTRWYYPTISSSVISFPSCLQSFPASGSLPVSQFFASGGQSIGASVSASVLPMNIQDWFPLGLTDMISL